MITVSNPPSTVSVPVATTGEEGKTKVDNNMSGDPVSVTTHSIGIPSGVAELDAGGFVPVAELPLDVAYTDTPNTFTRVQTFDDGGLSLANIGPGYMEAHETDFSYSSGFYPGDIYSINFDKSVYIYPPYIYAFNDTIYYEIYFSTDSLSIGVKENTLDGSSVYVGNGAATRINQVTDGTIHIQVAPVGIDGDPITWKDSLIINNDGSTTFNFPTEIIDPTENGLTINDGTAVETLVQPGSIHVSDGSDNVFIDPALIIMDGPNDQSIQMSNEIGALIFAELIAETTGASLAEGAIFSAPNWVLQQNGPATRVHQSSNGTIHLQTAPTGMTNDVITWVEALTINNDGTIDLSSTPTTTTAPSSGAADALPLLPTGYATIDIGGTPRKVAYY